MSKAVKVGNIFIGGNNSVTVQSMANIKTSYTKEIISQIKSMQDLGCDIVRVAVKDEADVNGIKEIKREINIPWVATRTGRQQPRA